VKGVEVENSIVDNKELRQKIFDDLMQLAAANNFNSLEKPK
jgi:hypothetical protein